MSVTTHHPEYDKMADEWSLVRACCAGQREIKALKTKALPAPGADKSNNYDETRYKQYLQRAIYTNITGRTQAGLSGAVFRKEAEIELSPQLDYMEVDSDGSGQSLVQLAKTAINELFCVGRVVFLVDYPEVPENLTIEQEAMLSPRAHIKAYFAEDFVNWKTDNINGIMVLTLAVLREKINSSDDEFAHNQEYQYRVLRLRVDGYSQQVFDEHGNAVTDEFFPVQSKGQNWDIIPLFACGAQNNNFNVDEIPLADIAHVNIGHYRNSADLEENCHVHGQLTLGISSSMDFKEFEQANPTGVNVGARAGHFLGEGGSFTSVQADANQLANELMIRKEQQMVSLGARLIEQKNVAETATAAKIDATGENSVLGDIVDNLEEAINQCLVWSGLFMGASTESVVNLNREFFPDSVDPQVIMAGIQLSDRGVMAKKDLRMLARKAEMIDPERSDDEIDAEAQTISPLE